MQHGPQTLGDLDARAAEMPDFGDGQLDKVLPVGSSIHEPKAARCISNLSFIQMPAGPASSTISLLTQI